MSIVITDGFMIEDTNFFNINKKLSEVSLCLKDCINEIYLNESVRLGSLILDYRTLGKDDEFIKNELDIKYNLSTKKTLKYTDILKSILNKDRNSIFTEDCNFDFQSYIILYPMENKTLLRITTSNYELKEIISNFTFQFDFLKNYNYWNNTDKPKEISEECWEKRRSDWNSNIYNYNLFKLEIKEDGLFNHTFDFFKLNKKSAELYEERTLNIAEDILVVNFHLNLDEINKNSFSEINKAFNRYRKSNDYKVDLEKEIIKLKEVLPKEYDYKEFFKN